MATWITHLMIADQILSLCPTLNRRGFCVGNIAPDCNVENETWTAFTPSREITHWMSADRKSAADCDRFYSQYLLPRLPNVQSDEEYAFLLGYYAHLIADAQLQHLVRDEKRVHNAWLRVCGAAHLSPLPQTLPESWDSIKRIIPRAERMRETDFFEAEYISRHPDSGYMTEILPLQHFPDYIDYLPPGSIVRKIRVMGRRPSLPPRPVPMLTFSMQELNDYTESTVRLIHQTFLEKNLL